MIRIVVFHLCRANRVHDRVPRHHPPFKKKLNKVVKKFGSLKRITIFTVVITKTLIPMRTIEQNENHEVIGLTTSELTEILKSVKKGTFAFFEIHTIPSMNKTGNPYFNQITKITKGNILIGGNYQTRVSNNTENPNFVPEKCNVGEKVEDSCVQYNEKLNRYYLQYEWFDQVIPKATYEFEGNSIEKQIFSDFMRVYTPNKYGVNIQSVKMENIKELHINKIHYIVENEVEVEG